MTDIQLSNDELNIVKNILSDLKNCQVFAFGSRAKIMPNRILIWIW